MNADQIQTEFEKLLITGKDGFQRRASIGMTAIAAATYRNYIKRGQPISIELKTKWLQKAGVAVHSPAAYTKTDMIALVKFCNNRASASAIKLGAEYVVEKFLKVKGNWHKQY